MRESIGSSLDVTWELVPGVMFYTVTISDSADNACTEPFDTANTAASGPPLTISIPQVAGGMTYPLEIEGKNTIGLAAARAHFNVADQNLGLRVPLAR